MKINQTIVERQRRTVDTGVMGLHDYSVHLEPIHTFVNRVTEVANTLEGVVGLDYVDANTAVIICKEE